MGFDIKGDVISGSKIYVNSPIKTELSAPIMDDIAHEIKYKLSFDTVFELVRLSVLARVDYSDNTIYTNKSCHMNGMALKEF